MTQKNPNGSVMTQIVLDKPTKAMLKELVKYYNSVTPSLLPRTSGSAIIRDLINAEYDNKLSRGLVENVYPEWTK